jgi:hypothetical protein
MVNFVREGFDTGVSDIGIEASIPQVHTTSLTMRVVSEVVAETHASIDAATPEDNLFLLAGAGLAQVRVHII